MLARSLRRLELCKRDFVLLLGTEVHLGSLSVARLQMEDIVLHKVAPVRFGRATLDKLFAWSLVQVRRPHGPRTACALCRRTPKVARTHARRQYRMILVIDSDAIALRALDAVFKSGEGTMGAHSHEYFQKACDVPVEARRSTCRTRA